MEEQDERFAVMSRDPRFKHIPKRERKVKIDRRFEAMFKDKNFKLKYSIDKRGRPVQQSTNENLKRFYEMSDSDSGLSEDENEKTVKKRKGKEKERASSDGGRKKEKLKMDEMKSSETQESSTKKKRRRRSGREELKLLIQRKKKIGGRLQNKEDNIKQDAKKSDFQSQSTAEDDDEDSNEDELSGEKLSSEEAGGVKNKRKIKDSLKDADDLEESDESSDDSSSSAEDDNIQGRVDYSRGKAFMESSSSESDDSDSEGNEEIDLEHEWGEMDTDAKRSEDMSSRLALCNMDWDRITAKDILVLLSSFKPSGGVIKCVKIYISDLGLERMKYEDIHGPKELVEKDEKFTNLSGIGEKKYFREKLRKYQMQRLKYFYSIIECDSKETASHIYDQCDGFEFESSAVKLDLRFVPDDMTFDREPKEVAESDSLDVELYKPSEFVNSALQQSKVDLTWDEDDPKRMQKTQGAFKKEDLEMADLDAYIASSSGDEDVAAAVGSESSEDEDVPHLTEEERLEKYRSLVRDLDKEKQEKEDADTEMEITWEPGLKETTEELVAKKLEEKDTDKSPWQQYLEKKKEKRKEKKEQERMEKEKRLKQRASDSDGELAFSDDELPAGVDLDDPFFSREMKRGKKEQRSKRTDKDDEESDKEDSDDLKKKAELELLVMDDDDNKQHFNLKEIMEQEKSNKKKKKKKKLDSDADEESVQVADNFEVDVKDSRFEAIYSSHHFAIDPSDPQFKPTKAMKALMDEKQARRMRGEVKLKKTHQVKPEKEHQLESGSISKTEVSALVKSIKRNASNLKVKGKSKDER